MPSAAVLAYLLSTLAIISSADARKEVLAELDQLNGYTRQQTMPREWGNRGERRILGYVESTAASSGVDHGDSHNTTEPSRLQPGVNAGLAFTAQDETALGAAPAEALPDGLGSDAWSSIAAEPSGDGIGSMSGQQGSQAWTTAAAPGPQGASGGSGSPEMGVEESAAWDSSISAGTSAAYSGKSMGAESLCDSLQGGPTEWMRHGGALGLACAQQRAMTDEHGQQGPLIDAHGAFKIVTSRQAPSSLQSLLRRSLALQQQMEANVSSAGVQSFMSAALHINVRDTAGALRAISASAVSAVAQAARSADESKIVSYTPNGPGGKLVGSDFTSFFLTSASDPTISGMRLTPGNYTVNPGANPDSHLWILCNPDIPRKTPFLLDLGGSVLIFEDQMKAGFLISDCVSVEVRGPARAYHSSMPFTQGTVTAISNDQHQGYYWEVQIHEGFPADTVVGPDGSKKDFLMRFDPQSLQMPDNYYDAICTRRTKIASSPPTYRFSFDVAQVAGKVGDYVALRGKGAHGIMMKNNTRTTVSGITMHNVGVFFIIDWTGDGNTFLNNTLIPWPDPVGANSMPVLMASNADGIHCLGASQGPRIIGNTIANAGDDAITVHGLYFIVAKVESDRKTVTIATGDLRASIAAGSSIVAYVGEQLMILGSANVTSIKQVGNPLLTGAKSKIVPGLDFSKQKFYEVALGAWPESFAGLEFDDLIANLGRVGSGFEVRDNLIMNNRGRGILLKAGNGSVVGNTIFRPTFWPIQVMPESFWLEADWSHDVRIANNHIDGPYGGILVGLIRLNEMGSGLYLNHRNITVVDNTLVNVNYAPIIITSAINVTIGNNTIQDALCQMPSIGQGYKWLDGSSLIYADNVCGLRLDPPNQIMNTANCTHGNYKRPITLGTNATDVTFADGRNYMA